MKDKTMDKSKYAKRMAICLRVIDRENRINKPAGLGDSGFGPRLVVISISDIEFGGEIVTFPKAYRGRFAGNHDTWRWIAY